MLKSFALLLGMAAIRRSLGQDILDNRETCAHRVLDCDPSVDHFETKITIDHSSSVSKIEYHNTHILLEQAWPTRGPWMKNTSQKVVFVRCGCPVPDLPADWASANTIHVPVSSVMVQMPNTLTKLYTMGARSKVTAIESNRYISDAVPEIHSDIRDGIIRRLDLAPNGVPSTRITLSFKDGLFPDVSSGFKLQLIETKDDETEITESLLGETSCIYPVQDTQESLDTVLGAAFNSVPGWVDAGKVWVLTDGDATVEPSTSLSYTMYFDNQLSMDLELRGETAGCGDTGVNFSFARDSAPNSKPIYHRLHDLPGGFPDVLITEPRSLGPLADDPMVLARQFIDSDPGEDNPLGRAELMKLMAVLVGSEETANTLFELTELRYQAAKEMAATAQHKPTVMVGKPGTWNEAARNSWMITVGSTYVGQLLKDANVEYRNSDDSVNQKVCGSGCGACPSGTSDTRCSVEILQYKDLFQNADYWISAGIGANCWSDSCNFELTSDELLAENQEIYSQFLPMQCNSVIGLDQSELDGGGNTYWELGRTRPDLVLMDLVTLMHPDVRERQADYQTTFFRMLPPLTVATGVPDCPRTLLPPEPTESTVYVQAKFEADVSGVSVSDDLIGASRFAVLDSFYPTANAMIASAIGAEVADVQLAMANDNNDTENTLPIVVTVRVPCNGQDFSCGVEVGEKLEEASFRSEMEQAFGLEWVSVQKDSSASTLVLDSKGDIIPLEALADTGSVTVPPPVATTPGSSSSSDDESSVVSSSSNIDDDDSDGLNGGAVAGIVIAALAVALIALYATYQAAYAKGQKEAQVSKPRDTEEGPQMVNDNIS